jgi:hypothetical protein
MDDVLFYLRLCAACISEYPFFDDVKWRRSVSLYRGRFNQAPIWEAQDAPCPADLVPAFGKYIHSTAGTNVWSRRHFDEILLDITPSVEAALPGQFVGQVPGFLDSVVDTVDLALPWIAFWYTRADESQLIELLEKPLGRWEQVVCTAWRAVLKERAWTLTGLGAYHPFQLALRYPGSRESFSAALVEYLREAGCKVLERLETPKQVLERRLDEMGSTITGLSDATGIDPKTIRRIREGLPVHASSRKQIADYLKVDPERLKWD